MAGKPKYCPYCGHEIQPEWKVCPYCGHELPSLTDEIEEITQKSESEKTPEIAPTPPTHAESPPYTYSYHLHKKKHTGLIVGIILFVIILIPIIYYGVMPSVEKATGSTVTTGAIRVIYHSVWGNDIKIYIDDEYMGTYTSDEYHTFYGIQPGTHLVTVKSLGDTTLASKEVTVETGKTITVELSFGTR